MSRLSGRTAVVTGGAQGIGLAIARRLKADGANVFLWDLDVERATLTAEKIGAKAHFCDVTDWDCLVDALDHAGDVDILVNSAGIAGSNGPVADYDIAEFRQIVDINLTGTFLTNRVVVPGMVKRGWGRIVNIASVAGKEGNPGASAYSASKAGVIGFTKSLGKELAAHDIAVNCVTPAAAKTAIFDQMSEEHIAYMLSKVPKGRFVEVDEIAAMVAWLASPECSFTTGGVFDISGGRATY